MISMSVASVFSPDGMKLATGSKDQSAKVWDFASRACVHTLPGQKGGVFTPQFSPDGKLLETCGSDKTVQVWDLGSGTCTSTFKGHTYEVSNVSAPLTRGFGSGTISGLTEIKLR
jgi:WD40 repeat protein